MQYRKTVASPCFKAPGCSALWNFRCLTHLKWRCCIFIVGTRDWLYTRSVLWGFQLTSRKSQYVAPSRFQSTICSTLCKTLTMQKYGQLVCTCHKRLGGFPMHRWAWGAFQKVEINNQTLSMNQALFWINDLGCQKLEKLGVIMIIVIIVGWFSWVPRDWNQ